MVARVFTSTTAAALLLFSGQLSSQAQGDYVISSTPTASVASKDQLDANQLFAKTWQIKGSPKIKNAKLDRLWMAIPGRVFISYDDKVPSELVAEITVSGSSKAAVEIITIFNDESNSEPTQNIGERLSLHTKENKQIETGAYLLTEIRVKNKRALRYLFSGAGEAVVEDNVLFTMSKEAFKAVSSKSRRMAEVASASAAATTGLVVEEAKLEYEATSREWFIRAPGGVIDDSITIDFSLLVPGNATLFRMESRYCDDCIGYVRASEATDSSEVPSSVEVVANPGSGFEGLEIRLVSNATGAEKALVYEVDVQIYPGVKATVNSADSVKTQDFLPFNTLESLEIQAGRAGSIFIVDKADAMYLMRASFDTSMNASVQVEFSSAVSTLIRNSLFASESSEIRFFGETTKSCTLAGIEDTATICLSASDKTAVNMTTSETSSQISFSARNDGGKNFECVKRAVPTRVPGNVNVTTGAAAPVGNRAPESADKNKESSSASSVSVRVTSVNIGCAVSVVIILMSTMAAAL